MIHKAEPSRFKKLLSKYPQMFAYLLVIGVFFFSLWLDNQNQKDDEKKRCEAGVDTRNVDRDQTQRIYALAMSFVPKAEAIKQLPPAQKKKVKAYVKQVRDFRTQSFKTIKPSPLCSHYVDDQHVTPEQWVKENPPTPLQANRN